MKPHIYIYTQKKDIPICKCGEGAKVWNHATYCMTLATSTHFCQLI